MTHYVILVKRNCLQFCLLVQNSNSSDVANLVHFNQRCILLNKSVIFLVHVFECLGHVLTFGGLGYNQVFMTTCNSVVDQQHMYDHESPVFFHLTASTKYCNLLALLDVLMLYVKVSTNLLQFNSLYLMHFRFLTHTFVTKRIILELILLNYL